MYDGETTQGPIAGAGVGSPPANLDFDRDARFKQEEARVRETKRNIVNQAMDHDAKSLGNLNVARSAFPQPPSLDNIEEMMWYQSWDYGQQQAGDIVLDALTAAAKAILRVVPNSAHRDAAIQHILNARMQANAAISFRGRF